MNRNEALTHNEACFDRDVEMGVSSTIPCLDLDREVVRRFARGELETVPKSLAARGNFPGIDLTDLEGKDVLCLGAGGGSNPPFWACLVPE